jgi:cell division protein FtsQ
MASTRSKFYLGLKLLSWLVLIGLFTIITLAAIRKREELRCDSILVRFKKDKNLGFIKSADVMKEINDANPSWSGEKISKLKLNIIENAVKQNEYVKRAELYLDSRNQINVMIEPKEPLARVNGSYGTFYLSENWDKMALNPNYSMRIVHLSGRVDRLINPITKVDSFINLEVKTILNYIKKNKVWTDAIDQIYISPDGKVELVLMFCEPIVKLGFIDSKFEKRMEKLNNFFKLAPNYQQLSNYSELDFQFTNQVIARKKNL